MKDKIVVVLEGQDLIEAQRILTDRDAEAALCLLKNLIETKLTMLDHSGCSPYFAPKEK